MLTPEQQERVVRVVDAVFDVPASRQVDLIAAICADDPVVRDEAIRIVGADTSLENKLGAMSDLTDTASTVGATAVGPAPLSTGLPASVDPVVLGRYHIIRPLGHGGMGEVFLAEQRVPIQRNVAIKLVRAGFDSTEMLARFSAERQTLARLDDPGIARLIDAGVTSAGRPYFVMEYVPGVPITTFADEQRLSLPDRLILFRQVCAAVGHAHQRGVIHRDLKPGNVLAYLDDTGKPQAKVIDFGIAKILTMDRVRGQTTRLDAVLGTYEYMSPEQAAGSANIDTRSDVYSLGVMLYELLSGQRPFDRAMLAKAADQELRRLIRDVEPPRPSMRVSSHGVDPESVAETKQIADSRRVDPASLIRTLRRELEWIPLKAMRKDRERRYATPNDMSADVQHYLDGLPLSAGPEKGWYRARKFTVRHRVPLGIAAIMVILLIAGTIGTTVGMVRAKTQKHIADRQAYKAILSQAYAASQGGGGGRFDVAMEMLDEAPTDFRGWEWDSVYYSTDYLTGSLAQNPGERLLTVTATVDSRRAICVSDANQIILHTLEGGDVLRREPGVGVAADFSSRRYAVIRPDGSLEVCDLDTGRVQWRTNPPATGQRWQLERGAFSLDGKMLLARNNALPSTVLFDAVTGRQRWSLPDPAGGWTDRPQFLRDADANTNGQTPQLLLGWTTGQHCVAISPIDGNLISSPVDGMKRSGRYAFTPKSWVMQGDDPAHAGNINQMLLIPRIHEILVNNGDGQLRTIRRHDPTRVDFGTTLGVCSRRRIIDLDSTPDQMLLLSISEDGTAHYSVTDGANFEVLGRGGENGMFLSPDEGRIVMLGKGTVDVACPLTACPLWHAYSKAGRGSNRAAAWSPDGKILVVADEPDHSIKGDASDLIVFDAITGKHLPGPPARLEALGWINGLAFTAEGRRLWVSRRDGGLICVDTNTWQVITTAIPLPTHVDAGVNESGTFDTDTFRGSLDRSPDGTHLLQRVAAFEGSQLRSGFAVRDAITGAVVTNYDLPGKASVAAAWSRAGDLVVLSYASADTTLVRVINTNTDEELLHHSYDNPVPVQFVGFSSDARRVIAVTPWLGTQSIDVENGEVLWGQTSAVDIKDTAYAADGATFWSGIGEGFVREQTRDNSDELSALLARWPAAAPQPTSVRQAQDWVRFKDMWYLSHPQNDWDRIRGANFPTLGLLPDSPAVAALRKAVDFK